MYTLRTKYVILYLCGFSTLLYLVFSPRIRYFAWLELPCPAALILRTSEGSIDKLVSRRWPCDIPYNTKSVRYIHDINKLISCMPLMIYSTGTNPRFCLLFLKLRSLVGLLRDCCLFYRTISLLFVCLLLCLRGKGGESSPRVSDLLHIYPQRSPTLAR